MNVEAKPRRLSLSNALNHDETRGTSVSYDYLNSWANERVTFLFTIVGLIIQIVIYRVSLNKRPASNKRPLRMNAPLKSLILK